MWNSREIYNTFLTIGKNHIAAHQQQLDFVFVCADRHYSSSKFWLCTPPIELINHVSTIPLNPLIFTIQPLSGVSNGSCVSDATSKCVCRLRISLVWKIYAADTAETAKLQC